jgi:hypothetical protein
MSWGEGFVRRFSLSSLVVAAALVATNASPAGAAVTIGSTFTPNDLFGGPGTLIQSSSPPANSYTVPTDGVITSWSFEAAAGTTPPLKLKVVRPAGGDDFTTVGDSQLETPTGGTLNTWRTRISVKAGDLLGHYYSDSTISFRFLGGASGFDTHELCCSDPVLDPPPGTTATYSPNFDLQIDVSAVLEPDADQDGFGDETQDKCVGTAGTANGCPSTVTIDRLKQKGDTKVTVTSTVPGAGTLKVGSPSPALASAAAKKSLKAVTKTLTATTKQQLKLTLKLTQSAIGQLEDSGKLKLKVKAVYTPVGGPPGSQTKRTKLKS